MSANDEHQEPAGGPLLALRPEDDPDVSQLITEDDTPVDNIYVEKQYGLLTEPLESSWGKKPFVALTNVGLFFANRNPPLVPDFLLSRHASYASDLWKKENRSYLVWVFGKPPDVVGEIVSDRRGGEDSLKLEEYARLGIRYYFIYDPANHLDGGELRVYGLHHDGYQLIPDNWLKHVELGLCLWEGNYAGADSRWLRWCERGGQLILTGRERAEQEHQRAEQERQRAEQERQRAEELAEKLRRAEAALRGAGLEPPC